MLFQNVGFNATSMMQNDRWLAPQIARDAGLQLIELAAGRSSRAMFTPFQRMEEIRDIRSRLEKLGLRVISVGGHRSLDREEESIEFCSLLERASELGASIVTTALADGCDVERYRDGLFKAEKRAEELGMTICLENHGYEHGSGSSLLFLLSVGKSVGLCYDTGNLFFYSNEAFAEDLRACAPFIKHFHLKDHIGGPGEWNFPALGKGKVPFSVLRETPGIDSAVGCSIEIEFTPQGSSCSEIAEALKESLNTLEQL